MNGDANILAAEDKSNKIMSTDGMEATEEEMLESFDNLAVED